MDEIGFMDQIWIRYLAHISQIYRCSLPLPSPHEVNHLASKLKQPGAGFNKCMQYIYISISSKGGILPVLQMLMSAAGFHPDSANVVGKNENEKSSKLLML